MLAYKKGLIIADLFEVLIFYPTALQWFTIYFAPYFLFFHQLVGHKNTGAGAV